MPTPKDPSNELVTKPPQTSTPLANPAGSSHMTPPSEVPAPASHSAVTESTPPSSAPSTNTGSDKALEAIRRCPNEMRLVRGAVCVDRWEARLVERLRRGGERPLSPYHQAARPRAGVRAESRSGVIPQGYISGTAAQAACHEAGKRLCLAEEWVAACKGPSDQTYPYGDERRTGICNDAGRKRHPVGEVTRRLGLPRERMWYDGMAHPLINQLPNTVTKTGQRTGCTNETGVFDMVGNLHEWIDDPDGTFRGGFYMDTFRNGEGCNYVTRAHDLTYYDYSTGFRCCKDPEPIE